MVCILMEEGLHLTGGCRSLNLIGEGGLYLLSGGGGARGLHLTGEEGGLHLNGEGSAPYWMRTIPY